jgi:hypothetical protein
MGLRGFFLTRKQGDFVGMALGSDSANFKTITWQLADPKWELCPKNCMDHGHCKVVSGLSGRCVCNKGWANKDCSVLAGWPLVSKKNAEANKVIVQTIQALLALKGIPQDFDGAWSMKTELGLKFFLKANAKKGFKETDPVSAAVWEALIVDVGAGWGKNPKGAKRNVVKAIQLLLNRRFAYKSKVGGIFDSKTEDDVKNFQRRFHLKKADGVVNINTWNKLVAVLPSTVHMWPIESKHQPFPDEQLYYVQSRSPEEYSNCRLYGTYAFSRDVPGMPQNSTNSTTTKLKVGAKPHSQLGEMAA